MKDRLTERKRETEFFHPLVASPNGVSGRGFPPAPVWGQGAGAHWVTAAETFLTSSTSSICNSLWPHACGRLLQGLLPLLSSFSFFAHEVPEHCRRENQADKYKFILPNFSLALQLLSNLFICLRHSLALFHWGSSRLLLNSSSSCFTPSD